MKAISLHGAGECRKARRLIREDAELDHDEDGDVDDDDDDMADDRRRTASRRVDGDMVGCKKHL